MLKQLGERELHSPIKRVGVIGGGQLAAMMATAAAKLGVELVVQTPHDTDPAVAIAADVILAAVEDAAATAELATRCDLITFENEFVNLEALLLLAKQGVCFRPGLQVLLPLLDKYEQRCYLKKLGLPVPRFTALTSNFTVTEIQFPAVLKARRHGYDGQGTTIVNNVDELQHRLKTSDQQSQASLFLLEEFVPFERELAVIAARSTAGEIAIYPIVETQQEQQVCRRVLVPARIDSVAKVQSEAIASMLLEELQAVGIFGIELFLTVDGSVLVNEISPRTHNSGHFTLDACETSQFEQHLRAVCDLPLGDPALRCQGAVMVNLLGYEHFIHPDYSRKLERLQQIPQAYVYWYGKTESRPGRKLGHVTVLLSESNCYEGSAIAKTIESIWYEH